MTTTTEKENKKLIPLRTILYTFLGALDRVHGKAKPYVAMCVSTRSVPLVARRARSGLCHTGWREA